MNPTLRRLGVDRMSALELFELIGQIWDSIADLGVEQSMPEWHRKELDRRRAAADANPEAGIPWEVVKARLASLP